jgi:hypothetical protein
MAVFLGLLTKNFILADLCAVKINTPTQRWVFPRLQATIRHTDICIGLLANRWGTTWSLCLLMRHAKNEKHKVNGDLYI